MLLTGELVSAARACEIGLINSFVPFDRLDEAAIELASRILSKSPLTLKIGKRAFYEQIEMGLSDAYRHCSRVMVENMMARDAEEGIDAFLEKREPEWKGR